MVYLCRLSPLQQLLRPRLPSLRVYLAGPAAIDLPRSSAPGTIHWLPRGVEPEAWGGAVNGLYQWSQGCISQRDPVGMGGLL